MNRNNHELPAHGGMIYATAARLGLRVEDILDFSCNGHIFARGITKALFAETPYEFDHYPDSSCSSLRAAIASHEGLDGAQVLPGNGSADLIWLLLAALAPRRVLCLGPAFSEYVKACEALGISCTVLPTSPEQGFACSTPELAALYNTDADLVIICSPNNPGGLAYPNLPTILESARAPFILLDLSYRDFLFGEALFPLHRHKACEKFIRPGGRLFTLHSFSKFFNCPGLRLGYLCGDGREIARLQKRQPPWTVNTQAQRLGQKFLQHINDYQNALPELRRQSYLLGVELRRLGLFHPEAVIEGPGFLTCGLAGFSAAAVQEALLRRRIMTRNCDNIPGMPPGWLRIQAREEADNARLVAALQAIAR